LGQQVLEPGFAGQPANLIPPDYERLVELPWSWVPVGTWQVLDMAPTGAIAPGVANERRVAVALAATGVTRQMALAERQRGCSTGSAIARFCQVTGSRVAAHAHLSDSSATRLTLRQQTRTCSRASALLSPASAAVSGADL